MRKTIFLGLVLALGVVGLAGFGRSWHHHRHDPARMAEFVTERVDDALDDVEATPEQRDRIHAIKDRMLARAQGPARDAHDEDRAAFLAAWRSPRRPTRRRSTRSWTQRADAMRALAHEAVDAGLEVHGDPHARAARRARGEGRAPDAPVGPGAARPSGRADPHPPPIR